MSRGRVLVTRPADQATELASRLRDAGFEPVVAPAVVVEPVANLSVLDAALHDIGAYRWVVVASANAASVLARRVAAVPGVRRERVQAAVVTGPVGARVLAAAGLGAERVVSPFSAAAVLEALGSEPVDGARVLLPRAEGAREELAAGLRARGALVDEVPVYRTVPVRESDALLSAMRAGVAAVTFFSPSAVRGFLNALESGGMDAERVLDGVTVACLGATTAAVVRAHGLRVDVVPADTTAASLVDALVTLTAARREVVWSA